MLRDRDGAIERYDRRRTNRHQRVVERNDLCPIGVFHAGCGRVHGRDSGLDVMLGQPDWWPSQAGPNAVHLGASAEGPADSTGGAGRATPVTRAERESACPGIPTVSNRRVRLSGAAPWRDTGGTRLPARLVRTHSAVRKGGAGQHARHGRVRRRVCWHGHLPRPRLQEPPVSTIAGFRGAALAVRAELEGLVASSTMWCAAVRHHPGASQFLPRSVHLCRNVMRPRVRS
jgi:hypothetical protein